MQAHPLVHKLLASSFKENCRIDAAIIRNLRKNYWLAIEDTITTCGCNKRIHACTIVGVGICT